MWYPNVPNVCQGCGAHLSDDFVRVFYPEDAEVTECINCPDVSAMGFEYANDRI